MPLLTIRHVARTALLLHYAAATSDSLLFFSFPFHWNPPTHTHAGSWTTSGLKSQGRLSVGSNRDREISMSVGLGRSKLDSKGGVVGGNIDVNTLEMVCK